MRMRLAFLGSGRRKIVWQFNNNLWLFDLLA